MTLLFVSPGAYQAAFQHGEAAACEALAARCLAVLDDYDALLSAHLRALWRMYCACVCVRVRV